MTTNPSPNINVAIGAFRLIATLDEDQHLTITVQSTDGTQLKEIEFLPEDGQCGARFTTLAVEQAFLTSGS